MEARQLCWEMGSSDPRVGQGRAEDTGLVRDPGPSGGPLSPLTMPKRHGA